jgi:hypothetical protein
MYRLYVWTDILCDYTCGVAFALASSVEEARQVILDRAEQGWQRDYYADAIKGDPDVYDTPFGYVVSGGG